jgi:hypothetical protein
VTGRAVAVSLDGATLRVTRVGGQDAEHQWLTGARLLWLLASGAVAGLVVAPCSPGLGAETLSKTDGDVLAGVELRGVR